LQSRDIGYPFGWVIPEEGTPVLVDAIAIPEGAPNPELARAFYEFVTSREALIDQARRFHRIPARTDVPRDSLPEWMRVDIPVMEVDWDRLATEGPTWMQYWSEQIQGRGRRWLAEHPLPDSLLQPPAVEEEA
ncbi:MAG: extracellular solute-binding protein, partial [Rhodothermales bacterium]|nr:extracellular solute-binding protein [Rhodothermales bacterium]